MLLCARNKEQILGQQNPVKGNILFNCKKYNELKTKCKGGRGVKEGGKGRREQGSGRGTEVEEREWNGRDGRKRTIRKGREDRKGRKGRVESKSVELRKERDVR